MQIGGDLESKMGCLRESLRDIWTAIQSWVAIPQDLAEERGSQLLAHDLSPAQREQYAKLRRKWVSTHALKGACPYQAIEPSEAEMASGSADKLEAPARPAVFRPLRPRQEAFCISYAETADPRRAYQLAY